MSDDLFRDVCNTMIEDFNLAAFDLQVAALKDPEYKALLETERADAWEAFNSGNDDWLRARLQAMARLLMLVTFSAEARNAYKLQRNKAEKREHAIKRSKSKVMR